MLIARVVRRILTYAESSDALRNNLAVPGFWPLQVQLGVVSVDNEGDFDASVKA